MKDNGRFKLSKLRIIALSRRFVISSIVFSLPTLVRETEKERKEGRKKETKRENTRTKRYETIAKYKWHALPVLSIFILGQSAVTGVAIKFPGHLSVGDTTRGLVTVVDAGRQRRRTTVGLTATFAFQINAVDAGR